MKLAILGGGGFRTPYVYHGLLHDQGEPRVSEIALYDVSQSRLAAMAAVLAQLGESAPSAPRVTTTTDVRTALTGADFVFAAVRVGGLADRCIDEHVAQHLGVLGQETTGPGGIAFAIRTVPVMLEYARLVRQYAPDAYFLNFTNPAGIITEALQSVLGDRVLGICDTPSSLIRRVAGAAGVDPRLVLPDYVGLNHLGWLSALHYRGRDVLAEVIGSDARLGALKEAEVFGAEWIRAIGAIPNEYLYYYYLNREAVRSINAAPMTRGDSLAQSQGSLFAALAERPDTAAQQWLAAVSDRNASYMAEARAAHGTPRQTSSHQTSHEAQRQSEEELFAEGYAGVALAVMNAISRNERATMILNVRNGSAVAGLPADAVVEVATMVDANGVHPLGVGPVPLDRLGLMQQVKAVERHAIAAAVTGDAAEALQAFALHPLVDSITVGKQLLQDYCARIPELAAILGR